MILLEVDRKSSYLGWSLSNTYQCITSNSFPFFENTNRYPRNNMFHIHPTRVQPEYFYDTISPLGCQ